MKKILILIITFLGLTKIAFAITGNVSARVVSALSISETTAMNFGSFTPSGTAGTITTAGSVTNVTLVSTGNAAVFNVSNGAGSGSDAYSITIDPTATLTGAGTDMAATLSVTGGTTGRTLTSGQENVNVTGSLAVGANQAAGSYAGTYSITVAYN